jgi:plasmid stabilization system protein ParE
VKPFLFGLYVEGDLREIRDYISKDSPESARRLMVRFVEAFRLLADPHYDSGLLDLNLVIYLGSKQPIEIVAVVHGARDVPNVLNRRA